MAYFSTDPDELGEFGCGADCSCKSCCSTAASNLGEVYEKEEIAPPAPAKPPAAPKMGGRFGEPPLTRPRVSVMPGQLRIPPFEVLTGYAPGQWRLSPAQLARIRCLAEHIVRAWMTASPVTGARLIGFAEPSEAEAGLQRAVAVRAALTDAISRLNPGVLRGINFSAEDGAPAPASGGGVRRVEIFLRVGLGTRAFGFRVASAERVADLNGPLPIGIWDLGQTPAPPRLSTGQYGLAMSRVTIPDAAIGLLLRSATFRHMARALDDAYLDDRHWIALQKKNPKLKLNHDFRVAGGGLAGRRILYVGTDPAGSLFIPGQSIESPTGWDIIRFNAALTNGDTSRWVEDVAHETAHAFARVTAKGPGPTTPVQRVRAAVLDECNARRRVQDVFTEIRKTPAGRAALAGHNPLPAGTCDCERDWFPVLQKRTYLEHFVLGMDWESAARKLSNAEIQKITTDVAAIPLKWSTKPQPPTMLVAILRGTAQVGSFAKQFPVLTSAAGQAALVLRIVDASWRQLIAKVGEGSPTWRGGAQRLRLERHARIFFKIPVSYTRCP